MSKIERIAERIMTPHGMTIRQFISGGIAADVSDEMHTWSCHYNGKNRLTADGMARWGSAGVMNLIITIENGKAIIHGLDNDIIERHVCSLFNTLAGRVNEDTYNKYVDE